MLLKKFPVVVAALLLGCGSASAQITSLDLGQYRLTATYALPPVAAAEASAVTWNWDTDTLFILGDEGDAVVEVDKQGVQISTMRLTGFDDTEGLTYLGGGRFVIGEERLQDVYQLDYVAGGSAARSSLAAVSLGPTVGNVGVEGFSLDPLTGQLVVVKEKSPQAIYSASVNFANGTSSTNPLFTPGLGVLDLADVQVLSTVASLRGTSDQDNLLVFSQESALLMEVTRSGQILSQFDFSAIATDAEGVTIDGMGNIYIVGETPAMYVLSPVPEPQAYAMALAGLALVGCWAARRRSVA